MRRIDDDNAGRLRPVVGDFLAAEWFGDFLAGLGSRGSEGGEPGPNRRDGRARLDRGGDVPGARRLGRGRDPRKTLRAASAARQELQ